MVFRVPHDSVGFRLVFGPLPSGHSGGPPMVPSPTVLAPGLGAASRSRVLGRPLKRYVADRQRVGGGACQGMGPPVRSTGGSSGQCVWATQREIGPPR